MNTTAGKLYSKLETARRPFIERARECSALTIPSVMPWEGANGQTDFAQPYNSTGSRGATHLASRILMTLLPPGGRFFRLQYDSVELAQATGMDDLLGEMDAALALIEETVHQEVDASNFRIQLFQTLRQEIITGNSLIYLPPGGGLQVYHLGQYVCDRGGDGSLLTLVIKEELPYESLGEELKALCTTQKKSVPVYTCVKRQDDGSFYAYQEIHGHPVPGTEGTYTEDELPWIPLRFIVANSEESYGRSLVEEHMGDLRVTESISQSITEAAAISARTIFMVSPTGTTRSRAISKAANGAIIEGNASDVSVLQTAKGADLQIAYQVQQSAEERLSEAFMLTSGLIRDSERTTAREVEMVAQQLEETLGGVYSNLAQELMAPIVRVMLGRLAASGKLPALPPKLVRPQVITGLPNLGRQQDLQRLSAFIQGAYATLGPEAVSKYIEVPEYLRRSAASLSINAAGLVRSEEEVAQIDQAANSRQAASDLGPAVISSFKDEISKQLPG